MVGGITDYRDNDTGHEVQWRWQIDRNLTSPPLSQTIPDQLKRFSVRSTHPHLKICFVLCIAHSIIASAALLRYPHSYCFPHFSQVYYHPIQ